MSSPATRAIITPGPEGLDVVIPAVRNLFVVVFLAVWLMAWLVGEVAGLAGLLTFGPTSGRAFLLLWMIFWTCGGLFAATSWLWMVGGAEHMVMGSSTVRLTRGVFGIGPTWTYEMHLMRNLRNETGPLPSRSARDTFRPWGMVRGRIAFEYEGRTVRFGMAIGEPEAELIVDRMKARFAFPEMPILTREGEHAF